MFLKYQSELQTRYYELLLQVIGALSKLSSDSDIPYLYYRMAEKIFCKAFEAKDLSRSDISIDASKENFGIGLKTFLHKNGSSLEKIAEFNKDRSDWGNLTDLKEIILAISKLRNARLSITEGISGVKIDSMLYHCVTRAESKMFIYETPINLIELDKISGIKKKSDNNIYFNDGIDEYQFNLSKSTLFKRFNIDPIYEIKTEIIEDPFEFLEKIFKERFVNDTKIVNPIVANVFLPLYSYGTNKEHIVPPKSGLNQWNAGGRARNNNEVYIPISSKIHQKYPNFFPKRDEPFTLKLPNNQHIVAKICQDNGKALMSNPNKELGEWLLRTVLKLKEGELLTYERLKEIGIDSVEISKFSDNTFDINFKQLGSFENFMNS